MKTFGVLLAGCLVAPAACAQSVALQGVMGSKALLSVDGSDPKIVAPGDTFKGVKVLSTAGDTAVLEFGGRRHNLRVGDSPSSFGGAGPAPGSGSRIVLPATSGGHFYAEGRINGQQVRFVVDTGATVVALSEAEAKRIGLQYKEGRPGYASTANGQVATWQVKLASVRIGDVEVRDVDASVLQSNMQHVLLGNAFLSRFQMKRENDIMVLERRY